MRHLLFIVFLLLSISVSAQLVHEKTYSNSAALIQLSDGTHKYFLMDADLEQCRLYNSDHSLWKTINLQVPANNYLVDIQMVSDHLFDTDAEIELLYIFGEYIPTSTSYYYKYETRIIDENETLILKIDGGAYAEIQIMSDDEAKLLLYSYDYSVYPYKTDTYVYDLVAYSSDSYVDISSVIPESANVLKPYPNPASENITLSYKLPEGVYEATLNVYNTEGKIVRSLTVDRNFSDLKLNVSSYKAGTYIYNIVSNNIVTATSKFVIQ